MTAAWRRVPALPVLLVLVTVTFALGVLQKAPCAEVDWQGPARYSAGCYSDLPYLYVDRGLAELAWPYDDDPSVRSRYPAMEYPVGISVWAYGAAWLTHLLHGSPDLADRRTLTMDELAGRPDVVREASTFVAVNGAGFLVLLLVSVGLLARVHPGRPWDALGVALGPPLALTALINWDVLALALVAGAL